MRQSCRVLLVVACVVFTLVGCAHRQHVIMGDKLLREGKNVEAIAAFQKALEESPDDSEAVEGLRAARRSAVRVELRKANRALSKLDYARALRYATKARRMPLDLDEVDLARRIDQTISKAAKAAEDSVQELINRGHYVRAARLGQRISDASPGMKSRARWADEIRQQAVQHYESLAALRNQSGMPGSAALQLALARRVGAEVASGEVETLWRKFSQPVCFGEPTITVKDKSGKAGQLSKRLTNVLSKRFAGLKKRCGEGTRLLGVSIELSEAKVVDDTSKVRAAKPFPGVKIATEEVYYEEIPYTVVEEVTENRKRMQKVERRDCAPRPGQSRGCRTWIEEVEVEVPVKIKREVEKVRKIERRRPVKDLPADKVLSYEVTTVVRQVSATGKVSIANSGQKPKTFKVHKESVDSSNAEAKSPRLVVAADPLNVMSLDEVISDAAAAIAEKAGVAVTEAVRSWLHDAKDQAKVEAAEGRPGRAEELFLQLLALGVTSDESIKGFFAQQYGMSVENVIASLSAALGRDVTKGAATETAGGGSRAAVPRRASTPKKTESAPVPAVKVETAEAVPAPVEESADDAAAKSEDLSEFEEDLEEPGTAPSEPEQSSMSDSDK